MTVRALFLVNGLGLGNSTRCHAIIQELTDAGVEVQVMTSGNGVWYLQGRPEIAKVHELESFYYASRDGRISIVDTLLAAGHFLAIAWRNEARIRKVVDTWKPDVCVIDSTYTIASVRLRGVPIVALNNADVVHVSYHRFADDRPTSIRAQFHAIEENDYRFHKWMADAVISPTLDPRLGQVGPPFHRVPPIVRRGYAPTPTSGPPKRVLIMLSGSVFGTPVELTRPIPGVQVDVVGRDGPTDAEPIEGVTYHGRVRDNQELVAACDLAVINGGFSAVSELFQMRKPVVVIPVPNHAEQWLNARTIRHLGVGTIGTEANLEQDLHDALERIEDLRAAYDRLDPVGDGAQEASALIQAVGAGGVRALSAT